MNPNFAKATFTPDLPGTYSIDLVVTVVGVGQEDTSATQIFVFLPDGGVPDGGVPDADLDGTLDAGS